MTAYPAPHSPPAGAPSRAPSQPFPHYDGRRCHHAEMALKRTGQAWSAVLAMGAPAFD